MFKPISFDLDELKGLSRVSQRAVIAAAVEVGLIDAETASAYCAECEDDIQAARYAVQFMDDAEASALLTVQGSE